MVRKAFESLTGKPTRMIVFSDDLDALRKAPSNVPNQDMLNEYIGVSLSSVPNPFDTEHDSFAAHNNAKLQEFLDAYGFEYEFMSATECYQSGKFNETLKLFAKNVHLVKDIVTRDYGIKGGNRKETYCPFIPIVNNKQYFELDDWTVEYNDITDEYFLTWNTPDFDGMMTTHIANGNVKLQWKADWAHRWINLNIDWESHGKDLISSAETGQRVCKAIGQPAPINYMYELFTDENGAKISKSIGNGLEFNEWVKYAPADSLRWFLFQNPRKSRKLFMGMVPDAVDRFIKELDQESNVDNGIWAIYGKNVPVAPPITYGMLLNLVNITNTNDADVLWEFVRNYEPDADAHDYPMLDEMIQGAINYYIDYIEPNKVYRVPSERDKEIMRVLATDIETSYGLPEGQELAGQELADFLMTGIYAVGKEFFGEDKAAMRDDYFKMLYQVLMGQDSGPRFGQFAVAYGVENTIQLLREKGKV